MAELREYTVTTSGGYETTMQLTEEDAKALGATPVEKVKPAEAKAVSAPPRHKARSPKGS